MNVLDYKAHVEKRPGSQANAIEYCTKDSGSSSWSIYYRIKKAQFFKFVYTFFINKWKLLMNILLVILKVRMNEIIK